MGAEHPWLGPFESPAESAPERTGHAGRWTVVAFISNNHYESAPERMSQILTEQAADLHSPPVTVEGLLRGVAIHAPPFAELVRAELKSAD